MTTEQMMRALFDIYYLECPNRRIEYTAEETNQCWIVMHGIELSYMEYQGQMQPIFMCGRLDDVYYFNTYKECERVWHMTDEEVLAYKKYLEDNQKQNNMSQPIQDASAQLLWELDSLVGKIENQLKNFAHVEEFVPDKFLSELNEFRHRIDFEFDRRQANHLQ